MIAWLSSQSENFEIQGHGGVLILTDDSVQALIYHDKSRKNLILYQLSGIGENNHIQLIKNLMIDMNFWN